MCDWIKTLQQITWIGNFIEIHVGYAIAGLSGNDCSKIIVIIVTNRLLSLRKREAFENCLAVYI